MFKYAMNQLRGTIISVHLPRFKMEGEYELKELLPMLGIKRVFDADKADLSGINGGRDLHVDKMVHKAVVEVNEEGSEAAADTEAGPTIVSGPINFNVDHSFLFFIPIRTWASATGHRKHPAQTTRDLGSSGTSPVPRQQRPPRQRQRERKTVP
ncbi:hypothetical protein MTO96_048290 [Rhipicephalus appendiculatus]